MIQREIGKQDYNTGEDLTESNFAFTADIAVIFVIIA